MTCEGQVLLLKRSPEATDRGAWGLPGGHLEPGEDPSYGAIREALEELGLLPEDPAFVSRYTLNGSYTALHYEISRASREAFEPALNYEHSEWGWFSLEKALKMQLRSVARLALARMDMSTPKKVHDLKDPTLVKSLRARLHAHPLEEALHKRANLAPLMERYGQLFDPEDSGYAGSQSAGIRRAKERDSVLQGLMTKPTRRNLLRGIEAATEEYYNRVEREVEMIGETLAKDVGLKLEDAGFSMNEDGIKMSFIFQLARATTNRAERDGALLGKGHLLQEYGKKYLQPAGFKDLEVLVRPPEIRVYLLA